MNIYKKMARYVLTSVLGMIGVSIYILADTYFISLGFGSEGLAVLNLTLPIYGFMYAIGQMLGMGYAIVYSLERAKGGRTEHYFLQAFQWALIFSLPFILLGIFAPDKILGLLGADAQLAYMGKPYVRIILCAAPLFMLNFVFSAFSRNDNATSLAMTGAIMASVFNIVFDYVFMFPCRFGFMGAAMATAACPLISIAINCIHFKSQKNNIGFKYERAHFKLFTKCASIGMSGFVGEFSTAVTSAVFNFMMLLLAGNTGVAAYSVIANIALVCTCIFNGIAQGIQPLFSSSFGAGRKDECKKLIKASLCLALIVAILMILMGFGLTDQLIAVFNSKNDSLLASYAFAGIRLYFLAFTIVGINVVLIAYFSAIGEAKIVIIGSLLRGMILISIAAIVMGKLFGMNGVWLSYLTAESLTLITILAICLKGKRTAK